MTTEMPIEHAAHAAANGATAQVVHNPHPQGISARLHNGVIDARQILHDLTGDLALITTPQAARVMEALARAVSAGVPDAEIEGFIAGLHGLANKAEGQGRQGSGPYPAFTPAHAMLPAPVDPDRGM
jgi:hypothetical protein